MLTAQMAKPSTDKIYYAEQNVKKKKKHDDAKQ